MFTNALSMKTSKETQNYNIYTVSPPKAILNYTCILEKSSNFNFLVYVTLDTKHSKYFLNIQSI